MAPNQRRTITDCKFSSKLIGVPESVLARLQGLLEDYTNSDDPEVNPPEPGRRSVKLKLEIARNTSQKTVRVLKREKKQVIGLHGVTAYINSACERSQELLSSYFPFDKDDFEYERQVTLTLKVIMKPLLMNRNAATKIYVVSYPAVLGDVSLNQDLGQEIDEDIELY
ncbi:hypothetical protein IFM46972_04416 [Aspergillus udagawae]|uniref:Uncharacterized protein n=1 Tax=Aspergillus udagawae TaxID=91492 RepID=A0A8H3RR98_9EURO|nr:hypothetical protein IFM46972_04416 [Aspergillus udagawae]